MENLDYYETLDVRRDADKSTIKKAYRKMAMKYHPDKNQGDKEAEEKFKYINEAYQVLNDENKRQLYDAYGKKGLEGNSGFSSQGGGFEDISSIFEDMFGGGFGGGGARRQKQKQYSFSLDEQVNVTIDFSEAIFGCKKTIKYKFKNACKSCKGTGAKGGKLNTCGTCDGVGQVHMKQGFMTFAQTCPTCNGAGQSVQSKCQDCYGNGYENLDNKFEVDIPEGVSSGNRIRVNSKGNIAPDGSKGDLYIQLTVRDDKHFTRHDNDIYIEVPIFFTQIALGANIEIPNLKKEKLELKIPSGSSDKQQFTFRGQGVKDVNGHGHGDFVVQIKIKYPKKLSKEQKKLLVDVENSFGVLSKPYEDNFTKMFDKAKSWFS